LKERIQQANGIDVISFVAITGVARVSSRYFTRHAHASTQRGVVLPLPRLNADSDMRSAAASVIGVRRRA